MAYIHIYHRLYLDTNIAKPSTERTGTCHHKTHRGSYVPQGRNLSVSVCLSVCSLGQKMHGHRQHPCVSAPVTAKEEKVLTSCLLTTKPRSSQSILRLQPTPRKKQPLNNNTFPHPVSNIVQTAKHSDVY